MSLKNEEDAVQCNTEASRNNLWQEEDDDGHNRSKVDEKRAAFAVPFFFFWEERHSLLAFPSFSSSARRLRAIH
ncbi:hypothetical protein MUCCIDRAFT_109497 [Mucor lusitanicus CBS 277.49]|uniref:Uncharacterized protein n=1 Tax=Mucor lusitanicus CBS 277.49 TaxID=747725 RepID=A0A168N0R5_MUCCL|nr:hypothetical protein MUCCIDRAFT_109497 [Mucor lusitanicus CBS 277.49]